jgi:ubiquinone/menaquinone biosynthesis C-methylase UbiE
MTQPRGYVDPHRLDILAERLKQFKQRTYALMSIQPGDAVLDVGCGPGTDTLILAGLVGPAGRAVGVDSDAAMIAEADRRRAGRV